MADTAGTLVAGTASAPGRPRYLAIGATLALLGAAGFATSGPISKAVLAAGLSPLQLSQARQTMTAVTLLIVVALVRPAALRIRLTQLPMMVVYGSMSYLLLQTCYFIAVSRIPVGVALLIQFTAPVLVALWVRLVRRVRLPAVTWMGAAMVLPGMMLVGEVWQGLRLDAVGVVAAMGTALCLVCFYLMAERGLADFDPLGLVTWGVTSAAVLFAVVQPIWTFPFSALGGIVRVSESEWPVWLLVLAIGVVSTAVPAVCEVAALRYIASPTASVLGTAEVVLGATFAWVLIGEALTGPQLYGGIVVLVGIALAQMRPLPQTRPGTAAALPDPVKAPPRGKAARSEVPPLVLAGAHGDDGNQGSPERGMRQ